MPSIGKDLVKIRQHLGLSLQDIQFATKLPHHTLQKIEDDTIFVDAEEGPIYTRNFVRSYGRVLKLEDDVLIKALDQREAGNYNHLLLSKFPEFADEYSGGEKSDSVEKKPATEPTVEKDKEAENVSTSKSGGKSNDAKEKAAEEPAGDDPKKRVDTEDLSDEPASETENEKRSSSETSDDKEIETDLDKTGESLKSTSDNTDNSGTEITKSSKKGGSLEKSTKEVDWANVGQKINHEKKQLPVWVIGLIILIIILGIAGYFIMQSTLLSTDNASQEEITTQPEESGSSSLSIELDEPRPQPQITEETPVTTQPVVSLDDTLTIVVYAAFGNVDPVRVWSDTKPRFDPYWVDAGSAMIFDFENTIQVRGPYDNMLIFLNGHLVENAVQNFYNEEEDYIELLRSDFTSDSKWSETTDLQVPEGVEPPEDIESRPTF